MLCGHHHWRDRGMVPHIGTPLQTHRLDCLDTNALARRVERGWSIVVVAVGTREGKQAREYLNFTPDLNPSEQKQQCSSSAATLQQQCCSSKEAARRQQCSSTAAATLQQQYSSKIETAVLHIMYTVACCMTLLIQYVEPNSTISVQSWPSTVPASSATYLGSCETIGHDS